MLTFDLVGATTLTAAAALVIAMIAGGVSGAPATRLRVAGILVAWFAAVVALAAGGVFDEVRGIGTPAVGMAALLPLLLLFGAATVTPALRRIVAAVPLPLLIAANAVRLLGLDFVLLHALGRLPAPFAPVAGWGDILVGAAALPVAWAAWRRVEGWRGAVLAWNGIGLLDLVVAVGLGIASAPGTPFQLFFTTPDTGIMGNLPWVLIPGFLVPVLMLTHLAVFYRLAAGMPMVAAPPARA